MQGETKSGGAALQRYQLAGGSLNGKVDQARRPAATTTVSQSVTPATNLTLTPALTLTLALAPSALPSTNTEIWGVLKSPPKGFLSQIALSFWFKFPMPGREVKPIRYTAM